jgi:hypothetical protein
MSDAEPAGNASAQTTIFNHWVPRSHLKRWSADGKTVSVYRLLVPNANMPRWKQRSIEYIAGAEHLYTSVRDPEGPDAFERWIKTEIEDPALEPLAKLASGGQISAEESRRVTRYVAALHERSPAAYIENTARWSKDLPGMMSSVLADLPARLEAAKRDGRRLQADCPTQPLAERLPLKVTIRPAAEPGMSEVRAEIVNGREMWLASMRQQLTESIRLIGDVEWSVIVPNREARWFTSDHPVLRLNFTSWQQYDFGGGWGNHGSEVIVPLSPTRLLYRQAGHKHPPLIFASPEQTLQIQRLVAEHAHRAIFAMGQPRQAERFRSRVVDADSYRQEQDEWRVWHERQSAAETTDADERPRDEHG